MQNLSICSMATVAALRLWMIESKEHFSME